MALKRLTTAEMLRLSTPWITDGHDERKALQDIEDTRPVLRRIERAHASLLEAQPRAQQSPPGITLPEEIVGLDDEHDDLVQGTLFLIDGNALLQRDRAQHDALLRLRDTLFPTGHSVTEKSPREAAGHAEMLKGRMTAPMKALLKSVPSPDGQLLVTLQRYLRIAQKLGAEDRKSTAARTPGAGAGADIVAARNRWIRSVRVLVATLEQEDIESPWAGTILERVRQAEVTAERRAELEAPPSDLPEILPLI